MTTRVTTAGASTIGMPATGTFSAGMSSAGTFSAGTFSTETPSAGTLLEIRGLTKRYGSFQALGGVSFDMKEGEIISVLGPSGCGKSTLLRLIAGLSRPDDGEIRLKGETIASPGGMVPPERRNVNMVFQDYALWPHMNVFDNVAYGLRKLGREEKAARVGELLELLHLGGLERRLPPQSCRGTTAARRYRPRPGHPSKADFAGRALIQSRHAPAHRNARGDGLFVPQAGHERFPCHARPGGSFFDGRQAAHFARRRYRPDRNAAGVLYPPGQSVGRLPARRHQPPARAAGAKRRVRDPHRRRGERE